MEEACGVEATQVPSARARDIPPFLAMEVMERAHQLERQGRRIIHLSVGEPDFPTPPAIVEAGVAALRGGGTRYTPSLGLPELREAIAERFAETYGVAVGADRVVVTTGTSAALHLILTALLDPDDEVLLWDPGYPCYPNFVAAVGGRWRRVPLDHRAGFRPDPERLAATVTPRTRAVLLNSPANPTGVVLRTEEWRAMADALERTASRPWIVSDEIYHGIVYGAECPTALAFTDRALVIGGFSKLHAMTGWRIGYCIVPDAFVRPLQKLQQNLYICAPAPAQHAALAALTHRRREVEAAARAMVATYRERRDALLSGLERVGLPAGYTPEGAFYVLVDARELLRERGWWPPSAAASPEDSPSVRLAADMLERAGVAVTPGIDFGPGGEGYLRFCYAASREAIQEAVERLAAYRRR
jgi:aspartate/methionine/tyrosine aminotransferase